MTEAVAEPEAPPANLAAALVAFQASISAVTKSNTADTGKYKYTFADLADIFEEIRPHLAAAGLAVTQALITASAPGLIGINTTIWHVSGQQYSGIVELPVPKDPQQIGSAITYYKRYTLSAMLGIVTDEDDDAAAASARGPQREQQRRPKTPDQSPEARQAVERIQAAAKAAGVTGKAATAYFQETYKEDSLVASNNVAALTETAEHYEALAVAKDNLGATEAS